jgi:hypothetical protein
MVSREPPALTQTKEHNLGRPKRFNKKMTLARLVLQKSVSAEA